MAIPDPDTACRFLGNVNFYKFRGYLEPFVNQAVSGSQRPFQVDTSFDVVVERYAFDTHLRTLLLGAFNHIEVSIRTQWTYHLSYPQGGGEYSHMDPSLFSQEYDKNLETLKQEYQQHGKRVHHYDFSSCPIWAIAEVISFGQLSRWYGDTTRQVRQLVARHYQLDERIFRSLLRHLATVRNFCAHHERLWDRDFITKFTIPKRLGTFPDPRLFFNRVDDGKLYNTLVMIAHMTRVITDNTEWTRNLVRLMKQYQNIPLNRMGFVTNWQKLDIWQG